MFKDEESAIKLVEKISWRESPTCYYCNSIRVSTKVNRRCYRCNDCKKDFSVRMGTIFGNSIIPIQKFLQSIYLVVTSIKGVNSLHLSEEVNVTKKSAWLILHKIMGVCNYETESIPSYNENLDRILETSNKVINKDFLEVIYKITKVGNTYYQYDLKVPSQKEEKILFTFNKDTGKIFADLPTFVPKCIEKEAERQQMRSMRIQDEKDQILAIVERLYIQGWSKTKILFQVRDFCRESESDYIVSEECRKKIRKAMRAKRVTQKSIEKKLKVARSAVSSFLQFRTNGLEGQSKKVCDYLVKRFLDN